ncbi:TetR/AcrR family transcriptional regulator [Tumebacillus sp. ITR2]|uniref:TetR/AcrR family transcriptional regulator n=1 Tax=Tumebacillus amylolyticus TaxID=2801339 RepID=A0ABS1JA48_9BACL|nr:TetR/AcrR family transcriptional regulator [Tumebacillus amylolyticus]MBL0386914.1 TetR/AcrR family transcriptional regulator [Tumebacillus amylolyticus]
MGRKKAYTESELLDMTKKLLLEHGYEGFHVKLLSQHLIGARSTIYQYYANKEEIVAACMKRVIIKVIEKASAVDESNPMVALQQLLQVYVEESEFHQLLGDANKINAGVSVAVAQDLEYIEQSHEILKVQLMRLFGRSLQEGHLREDIPIPALISVFFNLVNAPNMMKLPLSKWSGLLFDMWLNGAKR